MSAIAVGHFEAGVAALGVIDGSPSDQQQALNYFTAATDADLTMCDAWLGRIRCGDNASGTLYRAWRSRDQMGVQINRMGISAASLWARFEIGMGLVGLEQPIYDQSALAAALAASLAERTPPDCAEAIDTLSEATATAVTEWMRAAIYYRCERWPDVIDTVTSAKRLFNRDASLKIVAELAAGIAHAHLGQLDDAAEYLDAVEKQNALPEAVPVAQWFTALIARERGDEATAKDLMGKLDASSPSPQVKAALNDPGVRLQVTTVEAIAARTDPWDPSTGPSAADVAAARAKAVREELLAEATADLDGHVGMSELKDQVRTFRSRIRMAEKRRELNLKTPKSANHMIFIGPPGTGKTSVARVIAKILCGLGIVATHRVVERSGKDLVGEHLGDSEKKLRDAVAQALDGVLFIDEAYSLVSAENKGSNADAFGKAVVDTLLTYMENERHRLVVIIAGYESEIDQLLATNVGLPGRFAHRFRFNTYSTDELIAIADVLASHRDDTLAAESVKMLGDTCDQLSTMTTEAAVKDPVQVLEGVLAQLRADPDTRQQAALLRWTRDQLVAMTATAARSAVDLVGNGRFVRKVLEAAADFRDVRVDDECSDEDVDESVLMTIQGADMMRALHKVLSSESTSNGVDLTLALKSGGI
ncbi:type VII secretion AAA-ATPase EccA [Mycobacteroides abscessus]|uniref:type VII secretion AAA-ATPase EccA n=1 Tax=Mycobacteroides abscessus TaxID=36809 RepID=UPI0009265796|nr:type VII secretion AAA-ATPase EccA [Mycobacteroides abscessus]QCO29033.1 type VII secretion AAA-ATPase EccA [Mycobacteroides abscessus subsp. massiliense]SHY29165.1 ATPase central domain-containing protein [Mycobacteroides abscessus subsp. abscessus]SID71105.1 ATPase central domain-containing protein [Mycobacteroides abscessus subsp. abscessus]SIK23182.1 ATPase central domain-containing protein [Mycobacteroides abscessus subsp. abscessus]SKM15263.1 ATPase central domain-containing protein [